ncbi:anthocyanidin 3-O-glucosyltransferase 7 [Cicer arietinum]|uniref:Glycosyltransferase n=1 Tax=Cicer arietinum TaxID=3827 RepID=A0A067XTZ0_CICAR|nr:anthocyanidin 3-O-glucosyltransferase 7 [Cicer arietinum]AGU14065.1 UDP-glycosyltransferase [Cicer arietinum]
MSNSNENKKHIAVFPFPFSSHLLPLLTLTINLAHESPNSHFSFISTQKTNQTLFSKTNIPKNIKHYNVSDGIPKGDELLPGSEVTFYLQTGPENFQNGIDLAVAESKKPITCIIADAFVTPTFDVAKTLNVPWIPVWIPMSCSLSVHFHGDIIRAHCSVNDVNRTLDFLPGLSVLRVEDLPHDILMTGTEKENVLTRALDSLSKILPEAKTVVVSFFEELDLPLFVEDIRTKLKSMLYVPLFNLKPKTTPQNEIDESGCISFLEVQKAKSLQVVYVSFGTTVVEPPEHEIVALAEALEEYGFPFIWSLKENLRNLLPNGFVERTSTRGKVLGWVPQSRILGHGSIGAFVSQGGCNSMLEGISNGVPMIFRPYFADQGINARLAVDVWEVGVIIEGRVFSKNGLLKSLDLILVQQEGKRFRENALKMKKILEEANGPKGRATHDFKKLVELVSSS